LQKANHHEMSRKKKMQRTKRRAPRPESGAPVRDELNKASRALLGEDSGARAMRPAPEDASVQDPLGDWPED